MHLCVFTVFEYILFLQIHPYVKYYLDIQNLIEGDFPHHWVGTRKWNKMRRTEWRNDNFEGSLEELTYYGGNKKRVVICVVVVAKGWSDMGTWESCMTLCVPYLYAYDVIMYILCLSINIKSIHQTKTHQQNTSLLC